MKQKYLPQDGPMGPLKHNNWSMLIAQSLDIFDQIFFSIEDHKKIRVNSVLNDLLTRQELANESYL